MRSIANSFAEIGAAITTPREMMVRFWRKVKGATWIKKLDLSVYPNVTFLKVMNENTRHFDLVP